MPYDVFISYRRDGGSAEARLLRAELIAKKLNVFLDVADLKRGYFDEALLRHIAEAPDFVVVLSKDSLDRVRTRRTGCGGRSNTRSPTGATSFR